MISNSDNEDYESADGDNYSGLPGLLPVPNSPRRILDRNEYPISEIINNIFISNFLDKKSGHAHIVDINIVEKWMFLRDIKYDDIPCINATLYGRMDVQPLSKSFNTKRSQTYIEERYDVINDILKLGSGKISLAGGSIVDIINDRSVKNDFDIFFHTGSIIEA